MLIFVVNVSEIAGSSREDNPSQCEEWWGKYAASFRRRERIRRDDKPVTTERSSDRCKELHPDASTSAFRLSVQSSQGMLLNCHSTSCLVRSGNALLIFAFSVYGYQSTKQGSFVENLLRSTWRELLLVFHFCVWVCCCEWERTGTKYAADRKHRRFPADHAKNSTSQKVRIYSLTKHNWRLQ